MTASLLVFVPVALLVLISAFCFVGCSFDTHGLQGFVTYSDDDVIANKLCVAYWPLNDSAVPPPIRTDAIDVVGKANGTPHNGKYKNVLTDPTLFPCPGFPLQAGIDSAPATGTMTIGAPGIVQGDTVPPHDPEHPILTTCMQANGGFVVVASNPVTNPAPPFTVEAWIQPGWNSSASKAIRTIISSIDATNSPSINGFALWINDQNQLEAQIGTGAAGFFLVTGTAVDLSKIHHVALTVLDSGVAIFLDGTSVATAQMPAGASFSANKNVQLAIGAGGPWLSPRTQPTDQLFFPCFPFNGKIQDVAIYSPALDDDTINTHAQNGMGNETG